MKKIVSIIITIIILSLSILFIVLPKIDFSSNENRYLEKFPKIDVDSIISSKFQKKFMSYITDHFPFREELLYVNTKRNLYTGVYRISDVYYAKDKYLLEEYKKPVNSDRIIRIVNKFINKNEINTSFILVPTSINIYKDKLDKVNISYDEDITIDYYKEKLNTNFIDIREELRNNKDKYLYYKTDHHWTTEAAGIAYNKLMNKNNTYEYEKVSTNFLGTLYSKVLDKSLKEDYILRLKDDNKYIINGKESSLYDSSYLDKKDKYSYFLGGNKDLITIENDNASGSILIIKDSYANCFIPYIVNDYNMVYVIDPRYYKKSISEYIKENNIKDVLFIYNVLTLDEDLGILNINS